MKLSQFLGLSKTKPNLTPAIARPTIESLSETQRLRDFARPRLEGKNLGYGEDFLSKATNPVIAQREAKFRESELPQIQNQLSSRGVARSAGSGLATDMVLRAEQAKNRDIDELMSKFYVLNKEAEKRDQTEALGVVERLNNSEANLNSARAAESEAQVGRNAAYNDQINTPVLDLPKVGTQFALNTVSPGLGNQAVNSNYFKSSAGTNGAKQNILGSIGASDLDQMTLEDLLQLLGVN